MTRVERSGIAQLEGVQRQDLLRGHPGVERVLAAVAPIQLVVGNAFEVHVGDVEGSQLLHYAILVSHEVAVLQIFDVHSALEQIVNFVKKLRYLCRD